MGASKRAAIAKKAVGEKKGGSPTTGRGIVARVDVVPLDVSPRPSHRRHGMCEAELIAALISLRAHRMGTKRLF